MQAIDPQADIVWESVKTVITAAGTRTEQPCRIESSEAAVRAAEARDRERLFEIGGDINDACMSCHYHYDPTVKASRQAQEQVR
jgi:hypothetical protein